MLQVIQVMNHGFLVFVSGGHCKVLDDIAKVTSLERVDVLGQALNICLNKDSMDLVLKGIKNGLERKDEGMGRG